MTDWAKNFFSFFDEMAAKIIAKDPPYQIMRSAPLWNLLTAHRSGQRVAKKCQKLEESLILYMPDRLKTIWPSKQIEKRETTHCVWNSLKKSHWTLRAKRATFTFWVDKSSSNMSKWSISIGHILTSLVFQNFKLPVKQYYQTGQFQ